MKARISQSKNTQLESLRNSEVKPLLVIGKQDLKVYDVISSKRLQDFNKGASDEELLRYFADYTLAPPECVELTVM